MTKLLFFPKYLDKNLKKEVKSLGEERNYKVNFYPLNSLLGKLNRAYRVYRIEKAIVVGQESEYRFGSFVEGTCGFDKDKFFPILLKGEEAEDSNKVLEKIVEFL